MTEQEIREKISSLSNELEIYNRRLEEITKKKSNSEYKKYIGKWVEVNEYESGIVYVFVKEIEEDEFDNNITISGYGIRYDEQNKVIHITGADDIEDFYIHYPENIKTIDESDVIQDFLDFIKEELEAELDL